MASVRTCAALLSRNVPSLLQKIPTAGALCSGKRMVSQTVSATGGAAVELPFRPWKNPATTSATCFNQQYPTEYRSSMIDGAGMGWWAKTDVPAGVLLRTSSVKDGSFLRFANETEFRGTGWEMGEAVHYGVALKADPEAIYFSNPGIPCNHADPTRKPSVEYKLVEPGLMEVWTITDIKAGEEILTDYTQCFRECDWYDNIASEHGLVPVGKIGHVINEQYKEAE